MLTLITVAGIAIALVVFLNLLNAGKAKVGGQEPKEQPRVNVRRHLQKSRSQPEVPRLRLCPLCGTVLNQNEYLFASFGDESPSSGRRQAHIYGCRHCFRTDGVNINRGELSRVEP